MHKLDDQRAVIMKSMDIIEKFSGKRPRGWFGPGLTQTFDTLDYLSEAGVEYIGDWVLDDEPVTLKTTHKPVVALPYNFEIHDIVMMALQHHPSDVWYAPRAAISSNGSTPRPPSGRKSWRSPVIRIFPACRTASAMSSAPSRRCSRMMAWWPGTARQFSTGISAAQKVMTMMIADRIARRFVPHDLEAPIVGAATGPLAGLTAVGQGHVRHRRRAHRQRQSDWLDVAAGRRRRIAGGAEAARRRRHRHRQDGLRGILLQRDRRQRALRHAGQCARAGPPAGRLVVAARPSALRRRHCAISRSAATPAARCACRRRSTASTASARRTAASTTTACATWRRRSM